MDVRVTARCPICHAVTQEEMDYQIVGIGANQEIVMRAFNCINFLECNKTFAEVRQLVEEAVVLGVR